MWNWIKKLFGCSTEETRVVESEVEQVLPPLMSEENPNLFFKSVLGFLVETNQLKEYKCVKDFINLEVGVAARPVFGFDEFDRLVVTEEIKKFVKKFRFLKCKCDNVCFRKWIETVNID